MIDYHTLLLVLYPVQAILYSFVTKAETDIVAILWGVFISLPILGLLFAHAFGWPWWGGLVYFGVIMAVAALIGVIRNMV